MRDASAERGESFDRAVAAEAELFLRVTGIQGQKVVSFHNPSKEVVGRAPKDGLYLSAYDPRFMMPATKYLSDSNAIWREGDPKPMLSARKWSRVQILTHPIWWVWKSPLPRVEALRHALQKRQKSLDAYLRHSNDIWRELGEAASR
jgi:hypothetical protein